MPPPTFTPIATDLFTGGDDTDIDARAFDDASGAVWDHGVFNSTANAFRILSGRLHRFGLPPLQQQYYATSVPGLVDTQGARATGRFPSLPNICTVYLSGGMTANPDTVVRGGWTDYVAVLKWMGGSATATVTATLSNGTTLSVQSQIDSGGNVLDYVTYTEVDGTTWSGHPDSTWPGGTDWADLTFHYPPGGRCLEMYVGASHFGTPAGIHWQGLQTNTSTFTTGGADVTLTSVSYSVTGGLTLDIVGFPPANEFGSIGCLVQGDPATYVGYEFRLSLSKVSPATTPSLVWRLQEFHTSGASRLLKLMTSGTIGTALYDTDYTPELTMYQDSGSGHWMLRGAVDGTEIVVWDLDVDLVSGSLVDLHLGGMAGLLLLEPFATTFTQGLALEVSRYDVLAEAAPPEPPIVEIECGATPCDTGGFVADDFEDISDFTAAGWSLDVSSYGGISATATLVNDPNGGGFKVIQLHVWCSGTNPANAYARVKKTITGLDGKGAFVTASAVIMLTTPSYGIDGSSFGLTGTGSFGWGIGPTGFGYFHSPPSYDTFTLTPAVTAASHTCHVGTVVAQNGDQFHEYYANIRSVTLTLDGECHESPDNGDPGAITLVLTNPDPAWDLEIQKASDDTGTGATTIATVPGDTTLFNDPIWADETWCYRVRPVMGEDVGDWTDWVCCPTNCHGTNYPPPPPPPLPPPEPVPPKWFMRQRGKWVAADVPTLDNPVDTARVKDRGTIRVVNELRLRDRAKWRAPAEPLEETDPPPDVDPPPYTDPCETFVPPTEPPVVDIDPLTTRIFLCGQMPATVLGPTCVFNCASRALWNGSPNECDQAFARGGFLQCSQGGYEKFKPGGSYSQAAYFAWVDQFTGVLTTLVAKPNFSGLQFIDDWASTVRWPPSGISVLQMSAQTSYLHAAVSGLWLVARARPSQWGTSVGTAGVTYPTGINSVMAQFRYWGLGGMSPAQFAAQEVALARARGWRIQLVINLRDGGSAQGVQMTPSQVETSLVAFAQPAYADVLEGTGVGFTYNGSGSWFDNGAYQDALATGRNALAAL